MTRVLVVEDSPTQLERVRLILEEGGFEVETASDGREGQEKLEASKFDLVVSDIVMPRLSGYELCRWVKSDAGRRDIPVILLTTLNDPMDVVEALEAGADNFISKPYEPEYLLARIRNILESRPLRPAGISVNVNVEMPFMGRRLTIGSGKEQILGLLLSAFEDMVRTNRELLATQAELSDAKEKLEGRARASEEMYGTLMREASDSILITDAEGAILEANLQTANLSGRPISEILGRRASEFATPDQRGTVQSLLEQLGAGRSVRPTEFVVARPDGSRVEVEAAVSMVEVQGRKVGFALLRDVTERRRAAALAAAQHRVTQILAESRALTEVAPGLLLAIGTTLGWERGLYWQVDREADALRQLVSWRTSPGETAFDASSRALVLRRGAGLLGRVWESRQPCWVPDVANDGSFLRGGVAATEGLHAWVGFPVRSDGEVHGVMELLSHDIRLPEPDLLQKLASFGSQIGQFLERLRAEESARKLLHAVEQAENIIFITNPAGELSYVNSAFETIYGFSRTAVLGKTPRILKSGHHDDAFYRRLWDGLRSGDGFRSEIVNRTRDGRLVTLEMSAKPVLDAEGKRIGFISVQNDITAKKALEEQLRVSQKMEAIGQLAGGIAHDFNNMLTAIIGYADLLDSGTALAEPERAFVAEIQKASARAAGLTRQLLAFSRKQVLEAVVLSPNELIRNLEPMLRRLIREDVDLEIRLEPSAGNVRADAGQLEQVIMNLVVNARDAMPRGGKLAIETRDVDIDQGYAQRHAVVRPGPYVMVAVNDTGCGMDAETQARIFEPFFTTKEQGKGTGLGLSTVYGIVKQSGGNIWVYSEPGKGTTFKVYLPRVEETPVATEPASRVVVSPHGTETILLVEDETAIRKLTQRVLESRGYRVLEASNGADALELIRASDEPIHLLLTDVVMPGMPGPELAALFLESRPQARVICMSGYSDRAVPLTDPADHGLRFLEKPFTPQVLLRRVREALSSP